LRWQGRSASSTGEGQREDVTRGRRHSVGGTGKPRRKWEPGLSVSRSALQGKGATALTRIPARAGGRSSARVMPLGNADDRRGWPRPGTATFGEEHKCA